jgi:hypothetical protein
MAAGVRGLPRAGNAARRAWLRSAAIRRVRGPAPWPSTGDAAPTAPVQRRISRRALLAGAGVAGLTVALGVGVPALVGTPTVTVPPGPPEPPGPRPLWSTSLSASQSPYPEVVVVLGDRLVYALADNVQHALDIDTGAIRWTHAYEDRTGQRGGVGRPGDPEVDQPRPVRTEQHVRRLDVAVHEPRGVDPGQRRGQAVREDARRPDPERPDDAHGIVEGRARDVLGGQPRRRGVRVGGEHGGHERPAQPPSEPPAELGVVREARMQSLRATSCRRSSVARKT